MPWVRHTDMSWVTLTDGKLYVISETLWVSRKWDTQICREWHSKTACRMSWVRRCEWVVSGTHRLPWVRLQVMSSVTHSLTDGMSYVVSETPWVSRKWDTQTCREWDSQTACRVSWVRRYEWVVSGTHRLPWVRHTDMSWVRLTDGMSCIVSETCLWVSCVGVCLSVLQCVAVCCSVLQCVAVREPHSRHVCEPHVLQCVRVCCSVLQWVAVCCSPGVSLTTCLWVSCVAVC